MLFPYDILFQVMEGLFLEDQLNIRIELDEDRYVATSLEFPGCVGIGKTEKNALTELGKSVISNMEANIRNVVRFVDNPKIVHVKPQSSVSQKLRFLDKIFHSLGVSRKSRKDILKMFVNVDIKLKENVITPYEVARLPLDAKLITGNSDFLGDIDAMRADTSGFIISMPINFN